MTRKGFDSEFILLGPHAPDTFVHQYNPLGLVPVLASDDRSARLDLPVTAPALLVVAGFMAGRGMLYYTGLLIAGGLALHQQARIRERERAACFRAFLDNNRFGAVIFLGLALDYNADIL